MAWRMPWRSGNVDLEQGLVAVEASLRIIGDVAAILDPAGVLCFGRAVTAQKTGDNQLALSSLSEASEHAQTALRTVTQQADVATRTGPAPVAGPGQ